jgi:hypothetical protein
MAGERTPSDPTSEEFAINDPMTFLTVGHRDEVEGVHPRQALTYTSDRRAWLDLG